MNLQHLQEKRRGKRKMIRRKKTHRRKTHKRKTHRRKTSDVERHVVCDENNPTINLTSSLVGNRWHTRNSTTSFQMLFTLKYFIFIANIGPSRLFFLYTCFYFIYKLIEIHQCIYPIKIYIITYHTYSCNFVFPLFISKYT